MIIRISISMVSVTLIMQSAVRDLGLSICMCLYVGVSCAPYLVTK